MEPTSTSAKQTGRISTQSHKTFLKPRNQKMSTMAKKYSKKNLSKTQDTITTDQTKKAIKAAKASKALGSDKAEGTLKSCKPLRTGRLH